MNRTTKVDADGLVDVFVSAIPDMTSEELGDIEFAISVELQERAGQLEQQATTAAAAAGKPYYRDCNCESCTLFRGTHYAE